MARFEREAQTLAALNHPNLATIWVPLAELAEVTQGVSLDKGVRFTSARHYFLSLCGTRQVRLGGCRLKTSLFGGSGLDSHLRHSSRLGGRKPHCGCHTAVDKAQR